MISQIINNRIAVIRAKWHDERTTAKQRKCLMDELAVLCDIWRALPKELRQRE